MATLQEIEQAIRNADAAGRKADVAALAAERQRLLSQQGGGDVAAPAEQSGDRAARIARRSGEILAGADDRTTARARYEDLAGWKKPIVAAGDIVQLAGRAPLMGWGEKLVAGMRAPFTDKSYAEELAGQRRLTEEARARSGGAGTVAEIAGAVAGMRGIPIAGTNVVTRTGLGAAEGAGYGAVSAAGEDQDIGKGAATGAAFGAGGSVAVDTVKALGRPLVDAIQNLRANPSERARTLVLRAAQAAGVTPATLQHYLGQLGAEGAVADALGKHGTDLGRAAGNISPTARTTLEDFTSGRKAGQQERVAAATEQASGLPPGSRKTVADLQKQAYAGRQADIDRAYEAARAAGYDLPRTPFEEILGSPMGAQAYDEAGTALKNRIATQGGDANSELARLDHTKRRLDAIADVAYRAGDKDKGAQASAMSKKLRDIMDQTIAGPEYAEARRLRQGAFKEEEAFQTGADVAGGKVPLNVTETVSKVGPENQAAMRQGYGAETVQNLLNQGNTEGVLNRLNTPLAREAASAVLGDNASILRDQLARERVFNTTHRDIVGNSTTARQLSGIGDFAATTAAGAVLGGANDVYQHGSFDPLSALKGVGAALLARQGYGAANRFNARRAGETAPEVAEMLIGRQLPAAPPSTPPLWRPGMSRNDLARALLVSGVYGSQ